MPFYKDADQKRKPKTNYANKGSWDDEGSHYSDGNKPAPQRRFGPDAGKHNEAPAGRTYRAEGRGENRPQTPRPYGDRPRTDRPYGDKPRGDRPYGDKPRGDRPYGDKPRGDRPYGDKPRGDRPFGDKPRGDRPFGDRPRTDRPFGDKPRGDRPFGDKPRGDRPFGDKPRGDRPFGDKPRGDRPFGDKPRGDRPFSDKPRGDRPFGDRPRTDRPFGDKPRGDRPFSDRPRTDRPFGDKPRGDRPFSDRPRMDRPAPDTRKTYEKFEHKPAPREVRPVAPVETEESLANENLLSGRNPIREALKSGRDLEKLLVAKGELSGSAREIVMMAKEKHIPVQEVERIRLDEITRNHQGMLAFASAYQYATVEEILAAAQERGEAPFIVILDGITDPHNLGAIIRTAECAGAHGVIVPMRRAVGLTPAAVKASAGAVEHLKVARVTNITRMMEELREKGVWFYAADMEGESYDTVDYSGGVALVIGAEGEGVSRLVKESCDKRVSLPLKGKIDSLNASVAAGVIMYQIMRSRTK